MIVTEKQAAEMWCPAANGGQPWQDKVVTCIGPDCMWWRWWDSPKAAAYSKALEEGDGKARGYCGMAGKP